MIEVNVVIWNNRYKEVCVLLYPDGLIKKPMSFAYLRKKSAHWQFRFLASV